MTMPLIQTPIYKYLNLNRLSHNKFFKLVGQKFETHL